MKAKATFIDNLTKLWLECRYTLFFVSLFFIIGILTGPIIPVFFKVELLNSLTDKFLGILSGADAWWSLAARIFINNLIVTFSLFFSALLVFLPLGIIFLNGLIIGVFLELSYYTDYLDPGNLSVTIASLIPHGIFEIPGFVLSAVIGINLMLKLILGKRIFSGATRKESVVFYFRQFIALCLPLLLIAALMEATVSSYVMDVLTEKYKNKYLDENLAVQIDEKFLRDYNCHEIPGLVDSQTAYIGSPVSLGDVIYDKDFLQAFRTFPRADHWTSVYQCSGHNFTMNAYSLAAYSVDQAQKDQLLILQKLKYNSVALNNNIISASDANDDTLNFIFTKHGDRLISIRSEGKNEQEFLLTLSSSLL